VSGRRSTKLAAKCPTEHQEQCALFQWAALHATKYPDLKWLYAVPNGARTSMSTAKKLKAEGLRKGYPDIGLDVARGGHHGLRIELKRIKGSRLSPEQVAWHVWLKKQGYYCTVSYGWKDAADVLTEYLSAPATKRAA
jgi:hypothetical protein